MNDMNDDFRKLAEHAARVINRQKKITIVTHIDVDGICAAAIASEGLHRENIENEVKFIKQLDAPTITELAKNSDEVYWFTDLGSGSLNELRILKAIITDHHEICGEYLPEIPKKSRTDLLKLAKELEKGYFPIVVNPHIVGSDGAYDLSGAGATYYVIRELGGLKNRDLAHLAIVGAVGDLQNQTFGRLIGRNRTILEEGKKVGVVDAIMDINMFGRETRPLHKLFQYSTDPPLPGLTELEEECLIFLLENDVEPKKEDGVWKCWIDLTEVEKKKLLSGLRKKMVDEGFKEEIISRLVTEVYILCREEPGTPLHDAKEFATLLNSCGRYNKGDIALKICLGDRGKNLKDALELQLDHKKTLVSHLEFVDKIGISQKNFVQYFHAENKITDTLIGIVAGMLLSSNKAVADKPIVAFAYKSDDINMVKVSCRGTRALISKGLNLSVAVKDASQSVGGYGGGHNIAAGATIPKGKETQFLELLENIVKSQIGS